MADYQWAKNLLHLTAKSFEKYFLNPTDVCKEMIKNSKIPIPLTKIWHWVAQIGTTKYDNKDILEKENF